MMYAEGESDAYRALSMGWEPHHASEQHYYEHILAVLWERGHLDDESYREWRELVYEKVRVWISIGAQTD